MVRPNEESLRAVAACRIHEEAWETFQKQTPFTETVHYQIGPFVLRILFGSPELRSLDLPLRPFRTETPHFDFQFTVWSDEPKWLTGLAQETYLSHFEGSIPAQAIFQGRYKCVSWNQSRNIGHITFSKNVAIPAYEFSSPFRLCLHWALKGRRSLLLHAAAVSQKQRALLLVGAGGSGKSTTALHCSETNWSVLAEDYLLMDESFRCYPLYRSAKLTEEALTRFPNLHHFATNYPYLAYPEKNKRIFFWETSLPQNEIPARPVAIVLPQIGNRESCSWERTSPADALKALAPSTLFQAPLANEADFSFLGRLTRSLPAYRLHLGSNMNGIPRLLEELL